MSPPPLPEGLTSHIIATGQRATLRYWIDKVNGAVDPETGQKRKKSVLKVSGNVPELQQRLAAYYELDLTAAQPEPETGPPTVNQAIRDRQWDDLAAMGDEWRVWVGKGMQWKLVLDSDEAAGNIIYGADIPLSDAGDNEDLDGATPERTGHTPVCLPPAFPPRPQEAFTASKSAHVASPDALIASKNTSTANPPPFAAHNSVPVPAGPPPSGLLAEAACLNGLVQETDGLEACKDLREVLAQIKAGTDLELRERQGVQDGKRRKDSKWSSYRYNSSKRSRLRTVYQDEFGGDDERFFSFFTKSPPPPPDPTKQQRKRVKLDTKVQYIGYIKIIEAAPWMRGDLKVEREKEEYRGMDGQFCEDKWVEVWSGKNDWEVWRALKLERYQRQKKNK